MAVFFSDENIELILWSFAAPVLLHYFLNESFHVNYLVRRFFLVELVSFPNENLVSVLLMTRESMHCLYAKHQHRIILQVIKIANCGRFVPVWIPVEPWLELSFLLEQFTFLHTSYNYWYNFVWVCGIQLK